MLGGLRGNRVMWGTIQKPLKNPAERTCTVAMSGISVVKLKGELF